MGNASRRRTSCPRASGALCHVGRDVQCLPRRSADSRQHMAVVCGQVRFHGSQDLTFRARERPYRSARSESSEPVASTVPVGCCGLPGLPPHMRGLRRRTCDADKPTSSTFVVAAGSMPTHNVEALLQTGFTVRSMTSTSNVDFRVVVLKTRCTLARNTAVRVVGP